MTCIPTSLLLLSLLSAGLPSGNDPAPTGDNPAGAGGTAIDAQAAPDSGHTASISDPARHAVPDEKLVHKALTAIRTSYRQALTSPRRLDLLGLISHLREQAGQEGDPTTSYALLVEAEDLAVRINDPLTVLATVEQRIAAFSCGNAIAVKKAALARVGNPAGRALAVLLDHPNDAEANDAAGHFYAFEAEQWDIALPLMAKGSNARIKAIALQELASPSSCEQMAALGNAWYEEAKLLSDTVRDPAYARALLWFGRAKDGLPEATKSLVAKRTAELSGLILHKGITDWDHLTPGQWARLHGPIVEVVMTTANNAVPANLIPAGTYRFIPAPQDTWAVDGPNGMDVVDWHGDARSRIGSFAAGEMVMTCGSAATAPLTLISDGTKQVVLSSVISPIPAGGLQRRCSAPGFNTNGFIAGTGTIRVKVVPMDAFN